METIPGMPFYMSFNGAYANPALSSLNFDKHFNPKLKYDSNYHSKLHAMLKCVEKN